MSNIMDAKIWVDTIDLPTYPVGEPNKNPLFLEKRVYQGSSGKIYPLAFTDELIDEKVMKTYEVVYLENEYIKVMIMPEMGGKIYRAYDKTNNYDFVYYNHVVKPALVGLAGPWVSGGIEFNWPQHHRPSTFSPIEYTIEENEDGSKTCWVSEIDRMYGTKGMAGFTVYKDKAYIEVRGQLYNRTEVPQTFLWWANPAVEVNDYTKSIFPPDVHAVFDHGKRDVSRFPIATGVYYKMDYSEGVDISRYKNLQVPTSYMAYHSDYNFVGGYDFSVEAGILHIADHHISPGKKQWTWGNGDFGQAWDRNLTDEDGPYIELMTGVYTDNQPDFTWLAPKEEKTFKQYFMPYKKVGEVKNATIDAVLNLEVEEDIARVMLYTTSIFEGLTMSLYLDDELIYEQPIEEISPVAAIEESIELKSKVEEYRLEVVVRKSNGQELISYRPAKPEILQTPDPAKPALEPKDIKTCEELFLTGLHIEQYRHATYQPEDYYLEALKRDEGDIRNNNAYGLLMYRRGDFEESEKYFRKAIETVTAKNPNPYDSEPYYNLGLTLKKQGRYSEAYDAFYKSVWSSAWQDSGYYEIACINCINKEWELGLEHIDKSIVRNYHSTKARNIKSSILRILGRNESSVKLALETIDIDPIDFGAVYELYKNYTILGNKELADKYSKRLNDLLRGYHHNYLELAIDYGNGGLFEDAIDILSLYDEGEDSYPLINYYMGYYYMRADDKDKAVEAYEKAAAVKPDYCFPNRLESIIVLAEAMYINDKDSKAPYYLANLLYDKKQYQKAIKLWEASIEKDNTFAIASRNLALAYVNKNDDTKKGLFYLEKAFNLDQTDARVLFELDQLYKKLQRSYKERLTFLEEHMETVEKRDDLFIEYITLYNNIGDYSKALELIANRKFHPWEGGEGKVTTQYKRCRIELAKEAIVSNKAEEAIKLLQECTVYPHNLGEGKLPAAAENDIYYFMGMAYELIGEESKAVDCYEKASYGIDEPTDAMYYNDQPADMMFYQGLALAKLNRVSEAKGMFNKLFDYGENHICDNKKIDYFAVSLPDFLVFEDDLNVKNRVHCLYLMGLGELGIGKINSGLKYLQEAYQLNMNHQGIMVHRKLNERFVKM